jgi:crossover junction endodeoxyribonuclease RuvC
MRIIGIDPGYAITGFAVVDYNGNHFDLVKSGAIETKAGVPLPVRLTKIYDDMQLLVNEYKPDAISIEELFFNRNTTTAIGVAQGRGAVLIVAAKNNVPIYEYTPLQVKQGVVGYGRADKKQVQMMVKTILNLEKVPKLDDTTDAIAIAICHAHSYRFAKEIT